MPRKSIEIARVCEECGVAFIFVPKYPAQPIQRFCSRQCVAIVANRARAAQRTRLFVVCGTCKRTLPRDSFDSQTYPNGQKRINEYCRDCANRMSEVRRERAIARIESRFWARVNRTDDQSCWEWQGARTPTGYGKFGDPRAASWVYAHRFSCELANGEIPDGLWVLHRCDNPPCVNPAHLFLGTVADNVADMIAKGRHSGNKKRVHETAPGSTGIPTPQ